MMAGDHWAVTAISHFCLLPSVFGFRMISPQRAIIYADKLNLMSPTVPQGCPISSLIKQWWPFFQIGGFGCFLKELIEDLHCLFVSMFVCLCAREESLLHL